MLQPQYLNNTQVLIRQKVGKLVSIQTDKYAYEMLSMYIFTIIYVTVSLNNA